MIIFQSGGQRDQSHLRKPPLDSCDLFANSYSQLSLFQLTWSVLHHWNVGKLHKCCQLLPSTNTKKTRSQKPIRTIEHSQNHTPANTKTSISQVRVAGGTLDCVLWCCSCLIFHSVALRRPNAWGTSQCRSVLTFQGWHGREEKIYRGMIEW